MRKIWSSDPGRKRPTQQQDTHIPPAQRVRLRPDQVMPPTPWVGQGTVEIARGPGRIPTAEVERLKALNPGDVLETSGLVTSTRKEGRDTRYYLRDGAQVIVTGDMFNDVTPAHRYHGRGAITLAQQIIDTDNFPAACKWLQQHFPTPPTVRIAGQDVLPPPVPLPPMDISLSSQPKPVFELPAKTPDSDVITKAWLMDRGIPEEWAHALIHSNLAYAEEYHGYHNVIFPMYDSAEAPVAAIRRGAGAPDTADAFRGLTRGSRREGIWVMAQSDQPAKRLVLCEAPVDAVSYAILHGCDPDTAYVALGGLDVPEMLHAAFQDPNKTIVCAFDSDPAAEEGYQRLLTLSAGATVVRDPPSRKDWNQDLRLGPSPRKIVDAWLEARTPSTQESYAKELDLFARALRCDRDAAVDRLLQGKVNFDDYTQTISHFSRSTQRKKIAILRSLQEHAGVQPFSLSPAPKRIQHPNPELAGKENDASRQVSQSAAPHRPTLFTEPELRAQELLVEWLGRDDFSASTKDTYLREVALFGQWVGKGEGGPESGLAALLADKSLVLKYEEDLRERNLAPKTINKKLAALSSVLRCENGIPGQIDLPSDPRITDRSGPVIAVADKALGQKLRRNTYESKRDAALLALGSHEGLRLEEARGIKLSDLDLENNRIRILGKGRDDREWITIEPQTRDLLRECLYRRPGGAQDNALFVARGNTGAWKQMSRRGIHDMVKRLHLPRADGKGECSYHSLRHTAVTTWLNQGMPEEVVIKRARWHDPRQLAQYDDSLRLGR